MKKGFTLIELIMVIVILGILAAVAIPKYQDIRAEAFSAVEKGIVGAVRSGIFVYLAKQLASNPSTTTKYPVTLDDAPAGSASTDNPFFDNVIDQGVTDSSWTKDSSGNYTYSNVGTSHTYSYNSTTGIFTEGSGGETTGECDSRCGPNAIVGGYQIVPCGYLIPIGDDSVEVASCALSCCS